MTKELPAISLFAGAGGLDLGLEGAGFKVKVAVELDPVRCQTLRLNRPAWKVLEADVRELSIEDILAQGGLAAGEVALVAGGPPCGPFSKSAYWIRGCRRKLSDPRAELVLELVRVVAGVKPLGFVLENVPGLASKPWADMLELTLRKLTKAGYRCLLAKLNAADYGVPQRRSRIFMLGLKKGLGAEPSAPCPTHGPQAKRPVITAGQAIGELDDGRVHPDEVVGGKWGHLLKLIPPGGNYLHLTDRYLRKPLFKWRSRYWSFLLKLHPQLPSWTIQARPGPYVGPFHWSNRRLRIEEIKRLQTFPDRWKLAGSRREQWAQVGDATPPLLALRVGLLLHQAMEKRDDCLLASARRWIRKELPWIKSYVL